jgi:hypothetical protein
VGFGVCVERFNSHRRGGWIRDDDDDDDMLPPALPIHPIQCIYTTTTTTTPRARTHTHTHHIMAINNNVCTCKASCVTRCSSPKSRHVSRRHPFPTCITACFHPRVCVRVRVCVRACVGCLRSFKIRRCVRACVRACSRVPLAQMHLGRSVVIPPSHLLPIPHTNTQHNTHIQKHTR